MEAELLDVAQDEEGTLNLPFFDQMLKGLVV